ncbi:MAG TPA: 16S rRNA (cytidine(1402)-2'-O)-methyltransferase [Bacteroidales bacterium]|nr:16S rRNA (cytidine(1402)-2'-O)-methyltransferase [Bacteroidales bacterium]HCI56481.1 16S rRNA (cytidine(1402)-2'-O)-methyltransferase [Bacteroidales bacterium]HOU95562.1 16S rRNA (cytidine(1402)-2'-O)-methyltransferase [Bacteroidales bacterium]HQG36184.1 16S rRNA (cytidine(1402)-2'-O)-methyltransferase [Bacteroidales bacterium]HQG53484.1 16S rRNA (cytidine(1402)-2'-O)-methyltransferase [Bacteroidales bacterium]
MAKLVLVPTPLGNLKDITLRSLEVLKEVNLILAEDTRQASKLLKHYGIQTPCLSHHKFNEHKKVSEICKEIKGGKNIALISDAGTPGISDPGFLLVRKCIENDITVEVLPGPVAFVPALVGSGIPCDRFCFEGFLPNKKGRLKKLEALKNEKRTMIFYESPFRLVKALDEMANIFGQERRACVAREISKIHEEYKRGTLKELFDYYSEHPPKGEIVIVVEGE